MSMRAGWRFNGKHFTETYTERGGLRYFIDGKPTAKQAWQAELRAAKRDELFVRAVKGDEPHRPS